jgi:hypothetical protein
LKLTIEHLPGRLYNEAFVVGNGELFWKRGAALEIVRLVVRMDLAVLGGEVYQTRVGLGWATFLRAWNTDAAGNASGSWQDFQLAGEVHAAAEIEREFAAGLRRKELENLEESRLFFIAVCSHEEHAQGLPVEVDGD